jgi:hypothetical protein
MNTWQRNFPPPIEVIVYGDCGIAARAEVVAGICNKTNELIEFVFGLDAPPVPVPGQGNCDERMPLTFLRPCIDILNLVIDSQGLNIDNIPQIGDSMDYHGFVPLCRTMAQTINMIVGDLNG